MFVCLMLWQKHQYFLEKTYLNQFYKVFYSIVIFVGISIAQRYNTSSCLIVTFSFYIYIRVTLESSEWTQDDPKISLGSWFNTTFLQILHAWTFYLNSLYVHWLQIHFKILVCKNLLVHQINVQRPCVTLLFYLRTWSVLCKFVLVKYWIFYVKKVSQS